MAQPSHIPSQAYIDELRRLPTLHEQGDGVRSFMGIMLSLITAQYPLILVKSQRRSYIRRKRVSSVGSSRRTYR